MREEKIERKNNNLEHFQCALGTKFRDRVNSSQSTLGDRAVYEK